MAKNADASSKAHGPPQDPGDGGLTFRQLLHQWFCMEAAMTPAPPAVGDRLRRLLEGGEA